MNICLKTCSKDASRSRSRKSGQALAELAIVLPVLLIIAFGATDFARIYYHKMTVDCAAQAGAQYGSLSYANAADTAGIAQLAMKQFPTNITPQVDSSLGTNNFVTVSVSYVFNTVVKWPGVPNRVPLSSTVSMRVMRAVAPPPDPADDVI